MQEEGTAPGALTENSSLPAQGGESDFLHLPGLGCTLRYLNTPEVVRLHSSLNNNPALGLVSQMSKEPALKSRAQELNAHCSTESPAWPGAGG